MKRTMNNSPEIEACIQAVRNYIPTLKSSEVIPYAYKDMAIDFLNGTIDVSVWDRLMKFKYNDKLEGSSTRGCYIDDEDYAVVFTGESSGSSGKENDWAYMKRQAVKRAPLAFVTRLVLYYERNKLELEGRKEREALKEAVIENVKDKTTDTEEQMNYMELLKGACDKAAELIREGDIEKVKRFIEDGE